MILTLVLLPLLGAAVVPLAGRKKGAVRELFLRLFTLAELGLTGWLFYRVWNGEDIALALPGALGLGLIDAYEDNEKPKAHLKAFITLVIGSVCAALLAGMKEFFNK